MCACGSVCVCVYVCVRACEIDLVGGGLVGEAVVVAVVIRIESFEDARRTHVLFTILQNPI